MGHSINNYFVLSFVNVNFKTYTFNYRPSQFLTHYPKFFKNCYTPNFITTATLLKITY